MDQDTRRILDAVGEDGKIIVDNAERAIPEIDPVALRRGLARLAEAGLLCQSAEETFRTTPLGDAVRANRLPQPRTTHLATSRLRGRLSI